MAIIHLEQEICPAGHMNHFMKISIPDIKISMSSALCPPSVIKILSEDVILPAKRAVGALFDELHLAVSAPDKLRSEKHQIELPNKNSFQY